MDHRNFALSKINFILLAICFAVVILGFILMAGSGSTEEAYNPEIFSALRIKVAPMVILAGFMGMILAVVYRSKEDGGSNDAGTAAQTNA